MTRRLDYLIHGTGFLAVLWFPFLYILYLPISLYIEKKKIFAIVLSLLGLIVSLYYMFYKSDFNSKVYLSLLYLIIGLFGYDIQKYFDSTRK